MKVRFASFLPNSHDFQFEGQTGIRGNAPCWKSTGSVTFSTNHGDP